MAEEYDAHKAFEEYLKEKQGQEINPMAAQAAKREMELGEKGGYAAYADEPDKRIAAAGYPEGELFKTGLTKPELEVAVKELAEAREVFVKYLNSGSVPGFESPQTTTLFDVESLGEDLPEDLAGALQAVTKHLDPEGEMTLYELPEELNDVVAQYTTALDYLKRKAAK